MKSRYASVEFPIFLTFTERRKCSKVLAGEILTQIPPQYQLLWE